MRPPLASSRTTGHNWSACLFLFSLHLADSMKKHTVRPITWVVAFIFWFWLGNPAQAQLGFGGGEAERALRPGVYVPYEGAPFSHRYFYETGSMLYYGFNTRNFSYLEYLDRVDRAEKFGYRIPPDPFGHQPPTAGASRPLFGSGRGFLRRR